MFELLNSLTETLRGLLESPWLWVAVFLLSGLDAVLPFMPSETTVITVAVLLGSDLAALTLLAALASAGALAGDCLGHGLARVAGPRVVRLLQRGPRGQARLEWARAKVRRHTSTLIIAGRYVPGGRATVALATGSVRYSIGRFVILDAIGTSVWASYCAAIGYLGWSGFAQQPAKALLLATGIGFAVLLVVEITRRLTAPSDRQFRASPVDTVPGP